MISLRIKNTALLLNVVLVVLTLLSYCSPMVPPDRSAIIAVAGLILPLLLLSNVLFLLFWFFSSKKYILLSLSVLLLGVKPISRVLSFNSSEAISSSVHVASYNCNFLKSIWAEKEDEVGQANCQKFLKSFVDTDIFSLQEFGDRSQGFFENALAFPHKHQVGNKTLAIYSKYPIVDQGWVEIKANEAHSCIWADIELPEGNIIRVYNTHLQSNRHNGITVQTVEQDEPENVDAQVMVGLLAFYQEFASKRVEQVHIILDHASALSHPYIVCGDMNDTPQSYMYKIFSAKLKDAFTDSGKGFGFSYSGGIPFLRLDYIFYSPQFRASTFQDIENVYSDHDVITCELELS